MKKVLILLLLFSTIGLKSYSQNSSVNDQQYIQLLSVYFKVNSTEIPQYRLENLWDQGKYLSQINPCCKILLTAYTDPYEFHRHGYKLSKIRVMKVINTLSSCGVNPNRFIVKYVSIDNLSPYINPQMRKIDMEIIEPIKN